jgi:uncharacterized protein YyaL (SSP411 family)
VDWYPWTDEALAAARESDRPILLSVGYSACHWCHVMAHESFEDPQTAALMNRLFVNIKVDREERPDIDAVYMNAVVHLTGQGGWPMTVFLTPRGEPFFGGTYYPPEPRHGMPAFSQVLEAVAEAYRDRRAEVDGSAVRLTAALDAASRMGGADGELGEDTLTAAVAGMRRVYDSEWGGFGRAPKFPPASAIEFLLRAHRRGIGGALEMATGTLDGMAAGGMYDVLAGGFARYSVDGQWLVPHFEKMLYDNALLASAYLHGHAVTGDPGYRWVAEATLDFLLTDMLLPEGGFASALDADTLGEEGLTYVWTPEELTRVLGPEDGAAAAAYFGVSERGTFEAGSSVLRPVGEPPENIESISARLLEARRARPQPGRDDKAIAAWNGLALAALAESGWRLGRADHLAAAERCAEFLLGEMSPGAVLHRSYRDGDVRAPAFLDDVAAVANGLIELHTATGDPRWLEQAIRLAEDAAERFHDDEAGGFLYADPAGERLVARFKDLDDNPTPSGQSLLATVLLRLSRITGRSEAGALEVFRMAMPHVERAYHAFGQLLCALDLYLSPPVEVAVIGPPSDPATRALADAARAGFHPTVVYAFGDGSSSRGIALLEGKGLVSGQPAVYVCERFACQAPVTDPALLEVPA